jgi:hypothetical protein
VKLKSSMKNPSNLYTEGIEASFYKTNSEIASKRV